MPYLVQFLGLHIARGAAIGIVIAALAVLANVANLGTLMANDSAPYLALFLLFAMFAITFGSVAAGIAVMRLPWGQQRGGRTEEERQAMDRPAGSSEKSPR